MIDYKKYINALKKCAKEHENDRTSTGHIIVSDLCRDTANLLEDLEQEPKIEPCEDAVSRKDVLAPYKELKDDDAISVWLIKKNIEQQPSVRPTNTVSEEVYTQEYLARKDAEQKLYELQRKIGHCKDCKYFEYDGVAKVDGIPLIVAHEICSKWGDGCKTREDGYCFLFEPKESEEQYG